MLRYKSQILILIVILICANCTGKKEQNLQSSETGQMEAIHMAGMYQYMADAGVFTDCATDIRMPVAMEGDNAALERAYLASRGQPGEEMLVSLTGRIGQRPPMEGDGTIDTLIVTQFERIWPAENCEKITIEIPLANTHWKLVELNGATVEAHPDQRQEVHLKFQPEENRVSGFAGCNNINGSYETEAERLTFGLLATTMMACPQLDEETAFINALGSVQRFTILGESMVLSSDSADIARFKAEKSK